MADTDEKVTYRLERGGTPALVVRVPKGWRITFGPPMMHVEAASRRKNQYGPTLGATVRIYEGKQQRAAWMGVTEYQEISDELEVVTDRVSKTSDEGDL